MSHPLWRQLAAITRQLGKNKGNDDDDDDDENDDN